MAHKTPDCIPALIRALERANPAEDYIDDAYALRRIAMTLHRWHELECGVDGGGIDYDETTGRPHWYNANTGKRSRQPMPDRKKGTEKRLAAVMARYPTLSAYVQGDPRGAALYILRPGDVPEGADVDAYYSRGLPVYK